MQRESEQGSRERQRPDRPIRLIHCSDVHVTVAERWRPGNWFSKQLTGWLHWRFARGRLFLEVERILAAFRAHLQQTPCDCVIFSGDATALGGEAEFARAAALLGVHDPLPCGGFAVPGNHDYYTPAIAASGRFEKWFAPWQTGVRIDDTPYPFARRVGHLWLVGVNSCVANFWPHDARGAVGATQLDRLHQLLKQLDPGPRILVTHYPVMQADGKPETRWHGLRDLDRVLAAALQGNIALWLHGHRHHPHELRDVPGIPFPIVCAGSLTQLGCASFVEYEMDQYQVRLIRRRFEAAGGHFVEERVSEFRLCP